MHYSLLAAAGYEEDEGEDDDDNVVVVVCRLLKLSGVCHWLRAREETEGRFR
jgi:hypothetical protein